MELFTIGVGHYTEPDVYAAARVFTGWNLRESEAYRDNDPNSYQAFCYSADDHDTSAKTFSFPIANGSRTIPERGAAAGMQDGIDLITALATHPETARRLARKFWNFFVSEVHEPDPQFVAAVAAVYLQSNTEIRPVVRYILGVAVVPRSVGALRALFVATRVRGAGDQGSGMAGLLARRGKGAARPTWACNFSSRRTSADGRSAAAGFRRQRCWRAATSARRWSRARKPHLAAALASDGQTASGLMAAMLDRISPAPLDPNPQQVLASYLLAGGAWSGSPEQLETRAAGLARLLVGSAEYQLI